MVAKKNKLQVCFIDYYVAYLATRDEDDEHDPRHKPTSFSCVYGRMWMLIISARRCTRTDEVARLLLLQHDPALGSWTKDARHFELDNAAELPLFIGAHADRDEYAKSPREVLEMGECNVFEVSRYVDKSQEQKANCAFKKDTSTLLSYEVRCKCAQRVSKTNIPDATDVRKPLGKVGDAI